MQAQYLLQCDGVFSSGRWKLAEVIQQRHHQINQHAFVRAAEQSASSHRHISPSSTIMDMFGTKCTYLDALYGQNFTIAFSARRSSMGHLHSSMQAVTMV